MLRLIREPDGSPQFHETRKAVRVADMAGLQSWVPVADLPAELPAPERAEVARALAPASTPETAEAAVSPVPAESGATPHLGTESPPADTRPPCISDTKLVELTEAGVVLPPGSRVPTVLSPKDRIEHARAEEAEAKARMMAAKAAEAEAKALRADPLATITIPSPFAAASPGTELVVDGSRDGLPGPNDLRERARVAALHQLAAEADLVTTQARTQQSAILNTHVAQFTAANAQAVQAQATVAKRQEGTTTWQLTGLGCGGWIIGGIVVGALLSIFGCEGAAVWGLAKLGSVAGAVGLVMWRLRSAQRRRDEAEWREDAEKRRSE